MSSDSLSVILRPTARTRLHHAAVTALVTANNVTLLDDQSALNAHAAIDGGQTIGSAATTVTSAHALFSGSRDGTVHTHSRSHDTGILTTHSQLASHTSWITSMILLRDSRTLITASSDSLIKLWDIQTSLVSQTLAKHSDFVECLAYAPISDTVCSAGLGDELYLWRIDAVRAVPTECMSLTATHKENCQSFYAMDITATGQFVVTGSTDQCVRLWDTRMSRCVSKMMGHRDNVRYVTVTDDLTRCISGSADGAIKVWDNRTQRCVLSHQTHSRSHDRYRQQHHPQPPAITSSTAAAAAPPAAPPSHKQRSHMWTMAVTDDFSTAFTGGSYHHIAVTDLMNGVTKVLATTTQPTVKLHYDRAYRQLYCGTLDSALHCYDVSTVTLSSTGDEGDDDDGENDHELVNGNGHGTSNSNDDAWKPILAQPHYSLIGIPPIRRVRVIDDGWHVLTQNVVGHVHLWDIVNARLVKSYGLASFDELFQRSIVNGVKPAAVPAWFVIDVRLGCIGITLDRRSALNSVHTVLTPPLPDPNAPKPPAIRINLGETCILTMLSEWSSLENIALAVERNDTAVKVEADGTLTVTTTATATPALTLPSIDLAPPLSTRQQSIPSTNGTTKVDASAIEPSLSRSSSNVSASTSSPALPASSSSLGSFTYKPPAITQVSLALIIQPQRNRQSLRSMPAVYLTVPIPPLPPHLRPHHSHVADDNNDVIWEEALIELDRKRALYYQYVPDWVEQVVFGSTTERAHPPPVDSAFSDMHNTVMEWTDRDNGEDEDQDRAGTDQQDDEEQISMSAMLGTKPPSVVSQPRGISGGNTSQSTSTTNMTPTIPIPLPSPRHSTMSNAQSSADYRHNHLSVDPIEKITFQLIPDASADHQDNTLPSVIRGSLQVPSTMRIRRLTAYLLTKLQANMKGEQTNGIAMAPATTDDIELTCEGLVLPLDTDMGHVYHARSNLGTTMIVQYRRVATKGVPIVRTGNHISAQTIRNANEQFTHTPAKQHSLDRMLRASISPSLSESDGPLDQRDHDGIDESDLETDRSRSHTTFNDLERSPQLNHSHSNKLASRRNGHAHLNEPDDQAYPVMFQLETTKELSTGGNDNDDDDDSDKTTHHDLSTKPSFSKTPTAATNLHRHKDEDEKLIK